MTDYSELVERMRAYPANRLCIQVADALEAKAKEIAELDGVIKSGIEHLKATDDLIAEYRARIAELEAALKKADDALSWLIFETCDENYQKAYPQIYADLINANISSRAALNGAKDV
jgi:hypothetical protein